jgi:hypothetical protein
MNKIEIQVLNNPTENDFRKKYLEKGIPVVIEGNADYLKQFKWDFSYLSANMGDHKVNVYDWGDSGPTIDDNFIIKRMPLKAALKRCKEVKSTKTQQFAICQFPIEYLPSLKSDYGRAQYLTRSDELDQLPGLFAEQRRIAIFVSFFRGMHWHNGRHAIAQLVEGKKKFILYSPEDTKYLYPKKFISSPKSWFDETEAVFCSEIPFEQGIENVDHERFNKFKKATPYEVILEPGQTLFIPTHWWHYTYAYEPTVLITEFWDANLKHWGFPNGYRSFIMKPYRKYLFNKAIKFKQFTRRASRLK